MGSTPSSVDEPVLITGGQQGIGLATAQAFLTAGHPVAIVDTAASGPATDLVRQYDERLLVLQGDVTHADDVEAALDRIATAFGKPAGHLINNAAMQIWGPMLEADIEGVARTVQVNVLGPYLTCQRFARRRVAVGGGGSIVNLGSGCNALAFPNLSAYTVSKGAVEMLTKSAALELGAHGIRVNCIAPGAIETERTRFETDGYAERWSPLTPLGRVGQVEDVAAAIVVLCGPAFAFVSGQTLNVDGALFARAVWPSEY